MISPSNRCSPVSLAEEVGSNRHIMLSAPCPELLLVHDSDVEIRHLVMVPSATTLSREIFRDPQFGLISESFVLNSANDIRWL